MVNLPMNGSTTNEWFFPIPHLPPTPLYVLKIKTQWFSYNTRHNGRVILGQFHLTISLKSTRPLCKSWKPLCYGPLCQIENFVLPKIPHEGSFTLHNKPVPNMFHNTFVASSWRVGYLVVPFLPHLGCSLTSTLVLAPCFFFSPFLGCFLLIKFGRVSSVGFNFFCKYVLNVTSSWFIHKPMFLAFVDPLTIVLLVVIAVNINLILVIYSWCLLSTGKWQYTAHI